MFRAWRHRGARRAALAGGRAGRRSSSRSSVATSAASSPSNGMARSARDAPRPSCLVGLAAIEDDHRYAPRVCPSLFTRRPSAHPSASPERRYRRSTRSHRVGGDRWRRRRVFGGARREIDFPTMQYEFFGPAYRGLPFLIDEQHSSPSSCCAPHDPTSCASVVPGFAAAYGEKQKARPHASAPRLADCTFANYPAPTRNPRANIATPNAIAALS